MWLRAVLVELAAVVAATVGAALLGPLAARPLHMGSVLRVEDAQQRLLWYLLAGTPADYWC